MKISGFTIVRNVRKYHYPVVESIRSILPICYEFVVNVGDSDDDTMEIIRSVGDPRVRIIRNDWDMTMGKEVLSHQTNLALDACLGDWAFYLQSDEVIHEKDLPVLEKLMRRYENDESVDALRFRWLHFYGSYYRYRIDGGWYQKQDRIIRNNGQVRSIGDAFGFGRADGRPLRRKPTGCLLYHYGWVHSGDVMTQRRVNAENIGFTQLEEQERREQYSYGDLGRFPPYFGSHPAVMEELVTGHDLSEKDREEMNRRYWWHPARICKLRYKTFRRVKRRIQ